MFWVVCVPRRAIKLTNKFLSRTLGLLRCDTFGFAGTWCGIRTGEARAVSLSAFAKLLREQKAEEDACGPGLYEPPLTGTFPEIYVPHRPTLAKFRLGFWQIVCPGHRGTVRKEAWCGFTVE
jgi:hypothetical protein